MQQCADLLRSLAAVSWQCEAPLLRAVSLWLYTAGPACMATPPGLRLVADLLAGLAQHRYVHTVCTLCVEVGVGWEAAVGLMMDVICFTCIQRLSDWHVARQQALVVNHSRIVLIAMLCDVTQVYSCDHESKPDQNTLRTYNARHVHDVCRAFFWCPKKPWDVCCSSARTQQHLSETAMLSCGPLTS